MSTLSEYVINQMKAEDDKESIATVKLLEQKAKAMGANTSVVRATAVSQVSDLIAAHNVEVAKLTSPPKFDAVLDAYERILKEV